MADARQLADKTARRHGAATRGFLFADLRAYTAYVDQRGSAAAAGLLERYRALVRTAVAEHDGAEIKTEGDSFYVVFPSVSEAIRCAIAIVEAAGSPTAGPDGPIRVGIGIHAGETVETAEGYVGQPVNVAARLCALAGAGEVLVSGTVRALAQGMVAATFVPKGRRRLKGIAEAVEIYAVRAGTAATPGRRFDRRFVIAAAIIVAVAAGGVWFRRAAAPLSGAWTIGLTSPISTQGGWQDLEKAAELAITDVRAAGHQTFDVALAVRDESPDDPAPGAANATAFVADRSVVAMIGAGPSAVAGREITITNQAGLLDCSPTDTDPALTKPRDGALDLRSAHPTQINYVRLPAAADVEARAAASFAHNDLGSSNALVVDDTRPVGQLVASSFEQEFEALGGAVTRRALNPGADPGPILAPLATPGGPTLVFFGGFTDGGAPELRRAMVAAGRADIPFVGWDGLWDGSGAVANSFLAKAGSAAAGSYVSHPTVGTIRADFEQRYRNAYGDLPQGAMYEYAAASYACVEIILQTLDTVRGSDKDPATLREAVRAHVVDPATRFDTVVGSVGFDANGDSLRQVVSFYRADMTAAGGAGDWVLVKQQDFGPAR